MYTRNYCYYYICKYIYILFISADFVPVMDWTITQIDKQKQSSWLFLIQKYITKINK